MVCPSAASEADPRTISGCASQFYDYKIVDAMLITFLPRLPGRRRHTGLLTATNANSKPTSNT